MSGGESDGASDQPQQTVDTTASRQRDGGEESDGGNKKATPSAASAIKGGRKRPSDGSDESDDSSADEDEGGEEADEDNCEESEEDDEQNDGDNENDSGEDGSDEKDDDSSSGDDSSSESSSGDDGSSSEDDEEEEKPQPVVTDDSGRKLSAYEVLRLERIRRNKAKLAALGLESNKGDGSSRTLLSPYAEEMEKKRKEKRLKRRKNLLDEGERRSSSRKRSQVASYSELPVGRPREEKASKKTAAVSKWRTEKPRNQRIPLWIFREFRRIESERRQALKAAEKDARAAEIELKFARKAAETFIKKERKREENERRRKEAVERDREKKELTDLFRQVDLRRSELYEARRTHDELRLSTVQTHSKKYIEYNKAINEAMTRFPKAVAEAEGSLDFLLMARCPDDMKKSAEEAEAPKPASNKAKKRKRKDGGDGGKPKKKKKSKGIEKSRAKCNVNAGGVHRPPLPGRIFPNRALGVPFSGAPYPSGPTMARMMPVKVQVPNSNLTHPSLLLQRGNPHVVSAVRAMMGYPSINNSYQGIAPTPASMVAMPASTMPRVAQIKNFTLPIDSAEGKSGITSAPASCGAKRKSSSLTKPTVKSNAKSKGGDRSVPSLSDADKTSNSLPKTSSKGTGSKRGASSGSDIKKERKIKVRNVGGPVSADFAKSIQRSWLSGDTPVEPSGSKQFVPQVGDTILYYPLGHKEFLKNHTDHLGKKTKSKLRVPLWERAKNEKEDADKKKSANKPSSTEETGCRGDCTIAMPPQHREEVPAVVSKDANDSQAGGVPILEKPSASENPAKGGIAPAKKSAAPTHWWNEHWLSSMEANGGSYPLLCRVENTLIEFPHDSEAGKKNKNKNLSPSEMAKRSSRRAKKKPQLRLGVTLKPLTSLIPPTWKGKASDRLHPPPNFSVVVFPSKKCQPFLMPFFWTFRHSHSKKVGDRVKLQFDNDVYSGTIQSFVDNSSALERAYELFPEIFRENAASSLEQRLEHLLSLASSRRASPIPVEDLRALLQYIYSHYQNTHSRGNAEITSSTGGPLARGLSYSSLHDFICATLPRWDDAVIRWDDASVCNVSPWELLPDDPTKRPSIYTGSRAGDLVYFLDEPLREDVESSIQDYIEENPEAASLTSSANVGKAPSYDLCVPMDMSLRRILRRLKKHPLKQASLQTKDDKSPTSIAAGDLCCYYRSLQSLKADLSEILHNCVLHNDPDSDVVKSNRKIVDGLKAIVRQLESIHSRKLKEKEKETGGPVLLWHCNTASAPSKKFSEPFAAPMRRLWAQEALPDLSWGNEAAASISSVQNSAPVQVPPLRTGSALAFSSAPSACESVIELAATGSIPSLKTSIGEKLPSNDLPAQRSSGGQREDGVDRNIWIPQVGDRIIYSRHEHSKYLRGHFPSLTDEQRALPSTLPPWFQHTGLNAASATGQQGGGMFTRWLVGTIVSVRANFPPQPPADGDVNTKLFDDLSPILAIGIQFHYAWAARKVCVVHWRPCNLRGQDRIHDVVAEEKNEGTIRVKISLNSREVDASQSIRFEQQDYETKPRLARALGVSNPLAQGAFRPMQVKIKVNKRRMKSSMILHSEDYERDPQLARALFGEDAADNASAGHSVRVKIKLKRKEVVPSQPIVFSPKDYSNNEQLAHALSSKLNDEESNRTDSPPSISEPNQATEPNCMKDVQATTQELTSVSTDENESGKCHCCGLDSQLPFIRPAWFQPFPFEVLAPDEPAMARCERPSGIPIEMRNSVDALLEVLKQRCIQGVPPGTLAKAGSCERQNIEKAGSSERQNSSISKHNVAAAATGPSLEDRRNEAAAVTVPSLEDRRNTNSLHSNKGGTCRDLENLSKHAFLPAWTLDSTRSKGQSLLPLPDMSLDLVLRRLHQGYYRQITGATHDIREAYIINVLYLLSTASVESIKKIAIVLMRRGVQTGASAPQAQTIHVTGGKKRKKSSPNASTNVVVHGETVTLKEASLIKRIEKIRKLYATAITCFTHPSVVEKALGEKKQQAPQIQRPTIEQFITRQRQNMARKKLDFLFNVMSRDACLYRRPLIGAAVSPTIRVKITLRSDAQVNDRESKNEAQPAEDGKQVKPKEASGEGDRTDQHKNEAGSKTTEETNGPESKSEDAEGGGQVKSSEALGEGDCTDQPTTTKETNGPESKGEDVDAEVSKAEADVTESIDLSQPLLLEQNDYEADSRLVTFFFGREGRKDVCARCKIGKKSLFFCRVRKAHSNSDFDPQLFQPDALIEALLPDPSTRPNRSLFAPPPILAPPTDASATGTDIPVSGCQKEPPTESSVNEHGTTLKVEQARVLSLPAGKQDEKDSAVEHKDHALGILRKAELASQLANDALASANAAMETRPELSQEFIKSYFPIDESDGHYEICTVCGIGGDVLCCETCPNVSHAQCVNLDDIPEGDWFCPLCCKERGRNSADDGQSEGEMKSAEKSNDGHEGSEQDDKNDDLEPADKDSVTPTLALLLEELKLLRQKPKRVPTEQGKGEDKNNPNYDGDCAKDTTAEDDGDGSKHGKADIDEISKNAKADDDGSAHTKPNVSGGSKNAKADDDGSKRAKTDDEGSRHGREDDDDSKHNKTDDDGSEHTKPDVCGGSKDAKAYENGSKHAKTDDEGSRHGNEEDDDSKHNKTDNNGSEKVSDDVETDNSASVDGNQDSIAVGTKILKTFEGHGDFEGTVLSCPEKGQDFFRVRYIDGDEEDLSEDEIQGCVAYWKTTKGNDVQSPKTKRRKPKRFETTQSRQKQGRKSKSSPAPPARRDSRNEKKETENDATQSPSIRSKGPKTKAGLHRRPRGRGPLGKSWDRQRGMWTDTSP